MTNRWAIAGDPDRLTAAAAVLRGADPEEVFVSRLPGEYVMTGVARLLEALAQQMRDDVPPGHQVVSAAMAIAGHVLTYVPANGGDDSAG